MEGDCCDSQVARMRFSLRALLEQVPMVCHMPHQLWETSECGRLQSGAGTSVLDLGHPSFEVWDQSANNVYENMGLIKGVRLQSS